MLLKNSPVFAVSADNGDVGQIQGRQLAALLPNGGSVLYIQGPSGSTATEQRAAGMYGSKPDNVKIKLIKSGNWTGRRRLPGSRVLAAAFHLSQRTGRRGTGPE